MLDDFMAHHKELCDICDRLVTSVDHVFAHSDSFAVVPTEVLKELFKALKSCNKTEAQTAETNRLPIPNNPA